MGHFNHAHIGLPLAVLYWYSLACKWKLSSDGSARSDSNRVGRTLYGSNSRDVSRGEIQVHSPESEH